MKEGQTKPDKREKSASKGYSAEKGILRVILLGKVAISVMETCSGKTHKSVTQQ